MPPLWFFPLKKSTRKCPSSCNATCRIFSLKNNLEKAVSNPSAWLTVVKCPFRNEGSCACWWDCKTGHPWWETVWNWLQKLSLELLYDPAIPHLLMYSKKKKRPESKDVHRYLYTKFIAAWFTIARRKKQPRCLLTGEWMDSMCVYIRWNSIWP